MPSVQSLHVDYVVAAANLLAFVFGIKQMTSRVDVVSMVSRVIVAEFVLRSDVKIAQTDDEDQQIRQRVTISMSLKPCLH